MKIRFIPVIFFIVFCGLLIYNPNPYFLIMSGFLCFLMYKSEKIVVAERVELHKAYEARILELESKIDANYSNLNIKVSEVNDKLTSTRLGQSLTRKSR